MFSKFFKFFAISAIALAGFSWPGMTMAQDSSVTATFDPDPMFSESNFLPGSSSESSVTLDSVNEADLAVYVQADNVSDPDNFGDILHLTISSGSQTYFDDSLSQFFDSGTIDLAELGSGQSVTYDFRVDFPAGAGNEYQEKVLGFDVEFLFDGSGNEDPQDPGVFIISSGGGGGGGSGPTRLIIFNEQSNDVNIDSAVISWQTNYPATSRVIYSSEDEPHSFDFGDGPDYGYTNTTAELSALVTYREIFLGSLESDTTYYYRVISHRQSEADSVSAEHSFRTAGVLGEQEQNNSNQRPEPSGASRPPTEKKGLNIDPLVKGIKEFFSGNAPKTLAQDTPQEIDIEADLDAQVGSTQQENSDTQNQCEPLRTWPLLVLLIMYFILALLSYFGAEKRSSTIWLAILMLAPAYYVWMLCPSWGLAEWFWLAIAYLVPLVLYVTIQPVYKRWIVPIVLLGYIAVLVYLLSLCYC